MMYVELGEKADREERGVNGEMKSVGRWPKGRAFEEWLQRRDWVTYDRYRAQHREW